MRFKKTYVDNHFQNPCFFLQTRVNDLDNNQHYHLNLSGRFSIMYSTQVLWPGS